MTAAVLLHSYSYLASGSTAPPGSCLKNPDVVQPPVVCRLGLRLRWRREPDPQPRPILGRRPKLGNRGHLQIATPIVAV